MGVPISPPTLNRRGTMPFQKGNNFGKQNLGRKASEETREKLRKLKLGTHLSEEAKLKLSILNTGLKHSKASIEKMSLSKTGDKNPRWKGGKRKNEYGYIFVWKPEHPNAMKVGYVLEHRLVMEEHLGRYLTKEEEIHHINEIRDDNRIENLKLFKNKGEHKAHHHQLNRVVSA